jgi:hypothetical protein
MTTTFGYDKIDRLIILEDIEKTINYIKNTLKKFKLIKHRSLYEEEIIFQMKQNGSYAILCRTITLKRLLKNNVLFDDDYIDLMTSTNTLFNHQSTQNLKQYIKKWTNNNISKIVESIHQKLKIKSYNEYFTFRANATHIKSII